MSPISRLLTGTSLTWASDAAASTPHASASPRRAGRATTGGRRSRDMGSPPTSRADHPASLSGRACTPVASGGRAEVGAAADARPSAGAASGLCRLLAAVAGGRRPGFGSSRDRQLGEQPGSAAHD